MARDAELAATLRGALEDWRAIKASWEGIFNYAMGHFDERRSARAREAIVKAQTRIDQIETRLLRLQPPADDSPLASAAR